MKIAFFVLYTIIFINFDAFCSIPLLALKVGEDKAYSLKSSLSVYQDKSKTPTKITEIIRLKHVGAFKASPYDVFYAKSTSDFFWFNFKLHNDSPTAREYILEIQNPYIDTLSLYQVGQNKVQLLAKTGDVFPFYQRPIINNFFCFKLTLQANETSDFYLYISKPNELISFPIYLYGSTNYLFHVRQNYGFMYFFIGVVAIFILVSVFMFFLSSEKVHIIYCFYLLAICIFVNSGYGFEFLWSNLPIIQNYDLVIPTSIAIVAQLRIMQNIFDKPGKKTGNFSQIINFLIYFHLTTLCYSLYCIFTKTIPSNMAQEVGLVLVIAACFSQFLIVMLTIYRNVSITNIASLLFSISFLPFLASVLFSILIRTQLIDSDLNLKFFFPCALLVEVGLVSLSLAMRYNTSQIEKAKLKFDLVESKRNVLEKILKAREDENTRLARDLHDDLGATLSYIKGQISRSDYQNKGILDESINGAIQDLRAISHNLSALDVEENLLTTSAEVLIERFNKNTTIDLKLIYFGKEQDFSHEKKINIYRIMTELINNVIKHSEAENAILQLIFHADFLSLSLEDDGIGNTKNNAETLVTGIGLKNIRARAEYLEANIQINFGANGSQIILEIPYEKPAK